MSKKSRRKIRRIQRFVLIDIRIGWLVIAVLLVLVIRTVVNGISGDGDQETQNSLEAAEHPLTVKP